MLQQGVFLLSPDSLSLLSPTHAAVRMFLNRITTELQIPVLGLVDSDPYGLKILSVYMVSSRYAANSFIRREIALTACSSTVGIQEYEL